MIAIDGAQGEGGGQVLRTALSLAMITGEALSIANIRAKRRKPGLMRQHRTAVNAAATISGARVDGDHAGSTELEFAPGSVRHGEYVFAVGTAGSTTLVLQTVLPALLVTPGRSRIAVEGGTHNPLAPPYDFLERAFVPLLRRMGANVSCRLVRHGFFPAGGGRLEVEVEGGPLRPLVLTGRGANPVVTAACLCSALEPSVGLREAETVRKRLFLAEAAVVVREVESAGPGNAVVVDVRSGDGAEEITEVFTAFGERGVGAERVAINAAAEAKDYLHSAAAVGRHLADQLLLPLALAGGGEFATLSPSSHTKTNIDVIHAFLPGAFVVEKLDHKLFRIAYSRSDAEGV